MSIDGSFYLPRKTFTLDVQFQLPADGISVIFGSSASGKTTLLRCMAGLEIPEQGYFKIKDRHLYHHQRDINIPPHHRMIGYVFQDGGLFPHLTIAQNLCYGYKRTPPEKRRIEYQEIVTDLKLEPLLKRMPQGLSGGERQRVALARALLMSPQLLLLDEPISALDYPSKQSILKIITSIQKKLKIPIVYVTHDKTELMYLADYVLYLDAGKIIAPIQASHVAQPNQDV